jgi:hypothetical protein
MLVPWLTEADVLVFDLDIDGFLLDAHTFL